LAVLIFNGCVNPNRRASYKDDFEEVKVDQVVGNNIALRVFEKTIVCLNPRTETRTPGTTTNLVVTARTNYSVQILTNQLVSISTNLTYSYATNQLPPPPPAPIVASTEESAASPISTGETNAAVSATNLVVNAPPAPVTNVVTSSTRNISVAKAPSQHSTVENAQLQTSQQIIIVTNNLSIATTENRFVSTETNWIVTFVTNSVITLHTNQQVFAPDGQVADYFLSVEITQPAEFVPAQGESLILVVDGVRHGFSSTNTPSFYLTKRGFSSYLYKASPQVFEKIANAKDVRFRLRGTTVSIERRMSQGSRKTFKKFLARSERKLESAQLTNGADLVSQ